MKKKNKKPGYGSMFFSYLFKSLEEYELKAEGLKCERFITDLMDKGIYLENVRVTDETTVIFWCASVDHNEILSVAGRKYEISIISRRGMIPSVRKIFEGRGFAAGILIMLLMFLIQQMFVMEIEIKGNNAISDAEIRYVAAENGLKESGKKNGYNTDKIKSALFTEFDDITWINIARKGSYVLVEIVEGNKIKADDSADILHDLVASKSGYVEEIIVKNGYKMIEEGDYVQAGQIMIASQIPVNNTTYDPSRDGMYRYVDAEGIVRAKVIYKLSFQCEKGKYTEDELKTAVNEKTRQYIRENIPDLMEIRKNDLKFDIEENIIKGVVTLEVVENIALKKEVSHNLNIQKENEFAENVKWDNGQNNS